MCLIFALLKIKGCLLICLQNEKWTVADNSRIPFAGLFIPYFFSETNIFKYRAFYSRYYQKKLIHEYQIHFNKGVCHSKHSSRYSYF